MDDVPEVRFASPRGVRIAYQVFGGGDATIVAVPPAAQNIEIGWERPEIRSMLKRFGSFSRYLHFDKRGTGSSDRTTLVPGVDARVDDLRAVMDDAGIERAHLFAQSEGGPMTLLFGAAYPHRVESIILVGSGARLTPDDLTAEDRDAIVARQSHFADVWGTPDSMAIDLFAPSRADDLEFRSWHQRYERLAATPDSLRDLFAQIIDMDARDVLADLDVPVLVIHRTGDRAVPIGYGREVAELARDARFVEVDGIDHFCYLGDIDGWMDEVERFVTGSVRTRPADIAPATAHVTTLGRFAVTVDGNEVPTTIWGSRRARSLLKRLVAARGWPVTRDELIELLWPDDPDPHKLGARLSVQLSGVRRVLGGGVIADRQTVALDRDHVTSDLDRYLDLGDDESIVASYTGEFLPEDRYDDWTTPIRDDARSRFAVAAHRLLARAEGADDATAIGLARRMTEVDPYDERAHRSLVLALERAGDVDGARRAGDVFALRMADLGLGAPIDGSVLKDS